MDIDMPVKDGMQATKEIRDIEVQYNLKNKVLIIG
jgi:CheY-like chemotaxis protein